MIDIVALIKKDSKLRSERSGEEAVWRELNKYFNPGSASDIAAILGDGDIDTDIYTSNQYFDAEDFGSGVYSAMTNPMNEWVKMNVSDAELKEDFEVKEYLKVASSRFLNSLKSSVSAFYAEIFSFNLDFGVLGNAVFHSQIVEKDERFIDRTISIFNVVWGVDEYGQPDDIYNRFYRTCDQLIAEFGEENLAEEVTAKKGKDDEFEIIQAVVKNPNIDEKALGYKNKKFLSVIIDKAHKVEITRQGFRVKPLIIARMYTLSGKPYGMGIGAKAMSAARANNVMQQDVLDANEQALNGSYLVRDEDAAKALENYAGGITIGGMSPSGQPNVQKLDNGVQGLQITREMQKDIKEEISRFFKFSSMSLSGRTGLSVDEYYGEEKKNLERVVPLLSRYNLEFLNVFLRGRFDALEAAGQMPEKPKALLDKDIDFTFDGPFWSALKAAVGRIVMEGLQNAEIIGQMEPSVKDKIDYDAALDIVMDSIGMPAHVMRAPEVVDQIREMKAKRAAQEQALMQADVAAGAAQKANIDVGQMLGVNDGN